MANLEGLTLEKVPIPDVPRDEFEIKVTWMHGDADHYTYESLFGDRLKLDDFYTFVEAWYAINHNARVAMLREGRPTSLPGWWVFVYVDSKEEYEKDGHPEWYDDCWPTDVTNDWVPASFYEYEVCYYDSDGVKYRVTREENQDA